MQTKTNLNLRSFIKLIWRWAIRSAAQIGVTMVLLSVLAIAAWAQQPSRLTPNRDSAPPGATVRITVNPSLDANQPPRSRLLLRSAEGQRGPADITLQILEWHGDWLRARIPQNASTDTGALLLVLVDRRDNIIADSGNRFFRIEEASKPPREGSVSPGQAPVSRTTSPGTGPAAAPKSGPSPSPPSPRDKSAEKVARSAPDPSSRTDPRPAPEVQAKSPGLTAPDAGVTATGKSPTLLTTPGVAATAKVLPQTVADFVVIVDKTTKIKEYKAASFSFTLPAGTKLNEHAVLAYMVNPDTGGLTAKLTLSLNGREIRNYSFDSGAMRGMWESFDGTGILRDGTNTFEFKVGGLPVSLSDVVLWFHREVK